MVIVWVLKIYAKKSENILLGMVEFGWFFYFWINDFRRMSNKFFEWNNCYNWHESGIKSEAIKFKWFQKQNKNKRTQRRQSLLWPQYAILSKKYELCGRESKREERKEIWCTCSKRHFQYLIFEINSDSSFFLFAFLCLRVCVNKDTNKIQSLNYDVCYHNMNILRESAGLHLRDTLSRAARTAR